MTNKPSVITYKTIISLSSAIYSLFLLLSLVVSPVLAATPPVCNPALNPIIGGCGPLAAQPESIVAVLLARFFSAVLAIATIFFLFYLVINAWRWLSAGGDSGQISQARQGLLDAFIGLTIIASVFAIANLVAPILGLSNTNCSFPQQICWPTFP